MRASSRSIMASECAVFRARQDGSASGVDHARTDGDAGRLVDQDERARGAGLRVGVAQQRHGGARLDTSDLVEAELLGVLVAMKGVHVESVLDVLDQRAA